MLNFESLDGCVYDQMKHIEILLLKLKYNPLSVDGEGRDGNLDLEQILRWSRFTFLLFGLLSLMYR